MRQVGQLPRIWLGMLAQAQIWFHRTIYWCLIVTSHIFFRPFRTFILLLTFPITSLFQFHALHLSVLLPLLYPFLIFIHLIHNFVALGLYFANAFVIREDLKE